MFTFHFSSRPQVSPGHARHFCRTVLSGSGLLPLTTKAVCGKHSVREIQLIC
jgi:hypothetical protein